MTLISDILLVAAALGATFYCMVLSRRLSRFNDLEKGVGGAVAVLSVQVDDMTRTLERAQAAASNSTNTLDDLTKRAEGAASRLELLVAAMHDLPDPTSAKPEETAMPPQQGDPDAEAASDALFLRHRDRVAEVAQ